MGTGILFSIITLEISVCVPSFVSEIREDAWGHSRPLLLDRKCLRCCCGRLAGRWRILGRVLSLCMKRGFPVLSCPSVFETSQNSPDWRRSGRSGAPINLSNTSADEVSLMAIRVWKEANRTRRISISGFRSVVLPRNLRPVTDV